MVLCIVGIGSWLVVSTGWFKGSMVCSSPIFPFRSLSFLSTKSLLLFECLSRLGRFRGYLCCNRCNHPSRRSLVPRSGSTGSSPYQVVSEPLAINHHRRGVQNHHGSARSCQGVTPQISRFRSLTSEGSFSLVRTRN